MKKYKTHGIGYVPPERLKVLATGNVEALSILLGDKKFIFGNILTYLDIVVFAIMSQYYFVTPHNNDIRKDIVKYSNLKDHHSRVKFLAFSDWGQLCCQEEELVGMGRHITY